MVVVIVEALEPAENEPAGVLHAADDNANEVKQQYALVQAATKRERVAFVFKWV